MPDQNSTPVGFPGFVPADDLENQFEDDSQGLVEEIADTTTIEGLIDVFIMEMNELFDDLIATSYEGNAVKTHVELVNVSTDLQELVYDLKTQLLERIANRAETITEQGDHLRKQVVDSEEN